MMERLLRRAGEIAAARTVAAIARLAEAAAEEVPPGVAVSARDDGIVLSGRRIGVRVLRDARLRGFAALARTLS